MKKTRGLRMGIGELLLLAAGLSMDAFAVSVTAGLRANGAAPKTMMTAGLYFGLFQAVMPLIGYSAAALFAERIIEFDHWVAFGLLTVLGAKMIVECFRKEENEEKISLKPSKMLSLALATSIDALAVGVSFAFLSVSIAPAVLIIGGVTFILSALGVKIGSVFGARFKNKAEFAGGLVLILIGAKILYEHLSAPIAV